ncbi:MAG: protein O-GlcNAc transferase [Alphaproteobacteria bacterium]|jgi:predicted O-linked N-acetylglucosamine transferase (SPINDLY family)|nr:protein O-GlcNAc transferase [Alphaproteobacteria bacterium]
MDVAALLQEARALHRRGALGEAAERYVQVTGRDPCNPDALYYLAQISCQQDRLVEGIDYARRALAVDPERAGVHLLLGLALARLGQPEAALASLDEAIAAEPSLADAHGTRGDALAELGRCAEAVESYDRALAISPASTENWCNRGAALHDLHRHGEALASFERALALKPDFAQIHFNRGNALALLDRHQEALAAYDRALVIEPGLLDALDARGSVLIRLGRHDEAASCYERMLALDPQHPRALGELANCQLMMCDWNSTTRVASALDRRVREGTSVISPFILLGFPIDSAALLECSRGYVAHRIRKRAALVRERVMRRDGKIRIAYLSADFRDHATAYLAAGLFEHHDRARFDVIGISFGHDDGSDMRARIVRSFDQFHDVTTSSDLDIAKLIQEHDVDIAVDLKGHTEGARPGILAYRPAPVQATFLGYPGPFAADFIDYVIADPVVLPRSQQPFYPERIVHLPDSYQVNDSKRPIATRIPPRRELGLPDDAVVFACFNSAWKISRPMFDIWMRLLHAVEGSVLWLFGTNAFASGNLRREAAARGVDPARLVFAPFRALPEHLARLRRADLFLDTLPCNAHTTASDALWAGLPLVTCLGDTVAGRVAASLLHAAGLPELVTGNLHDYEALALKLATDPPRLGSLRRQLEDNRLRCPLFDTDRFRRHLEAAFSTMWQMQRRGERPQGFSVDPIGAC